MKCFNHEDRDAVATCQVCGKGLCKECASKHTPCMCDECYEREQEKKRYTEMEQRQRQELEEYNVKLNAEQRKNDARVDTKKEFRSVVIKGLIATIVFGILVIYNIYHGTEIQDPMIMWLVFPMVFCFPCGWQLTTYLWEEYLYVVEDFINDIIDSIGFIGIIAIVIGLTVKLALKLFLLLVKYFGRLVLSLIVGIPYFVYILIKFLSKMKKLEME